MSKICLKRLRFEYRQLQKSKGYDHIIARPLEENMLEWHFVILPPAGSGAYSGGCYWGKLIFPETYPHAPPAIMMITPSGRFHVNTRICLSMSDFHPETWVPSWNVGAIIMGLFTFMLTDARTTGSIRMSSRERSILARKSLAFNIKQKKFRRLFPQLCDQNASRKNASSTYDSDSKDEKKNTKGNDRMIRKENQNYTFKIVYILFAVFFIIPVLMNVYYFAD